MKFTISYGSTPVHTFEIEEQRHDLKAKSQIARSFDLQPTERAMEQATLFTPFDVDEIEEPPCDHADTEPQANLFGGIDQVCIACGSRVP